MCYFCSIPSVNLNYVLDFMCDILSDEHSNSRLWLGYFWNSNGKTDFDICQKLPLYGELKRKFLLDSPQIYVYKGESILIEHKDVYSYHQSGGPFYLMFRYIGGPRLSKKAIYDRLVNRK